MNRTVTITLTALAGAMVALAAGCGSSAPTSAAPAQSPGTTSPSPPGSQAGQVGDKFTVTGGDMKYYVTLAGVDQQAQPASEYASADPGHHLAAAQFRVAAITKTDENSNLSATVTGSNDQAYTSSLDEVAAGTNFANGQILLEPGSSLVGWVAFQLPDGVTISKVRWTPTSAVGPRGAQWVVSGPAAASPTGTSTAGATATPTTSAPTAGSSPGTAAPGQAASPEDTVNAYFDAINLRDYQQAWNLGGKNTTSSYASFVSGFKTTSMVSVQVLDVSGDAGTGVVTARLNTLETDGSTKVFEGTYTVKNGVITEFNVRQVS
jgi:hypothetical protein